MISRERLIEIIDSIGVAYNECDFTVEHMDQLPRIAFYDYIWESISASGNSYKDEVTYQIDFYSRTSRHPKLILLRTALLNEGIKPTINHEQVIDSAGNKYQHAFMSVTVFESIGD